MQNSRKGFYPMVKPQVGQQRVIPPWSWVGERGLRVVTEEATLARYSALLSREFMEIEDIIPADGSILLVLKSGAAPSAELWLALSAPLADTPHTSGILHEIPVVYGGASGPDLPEMARRAGMSEVDYIDNHVAAEFTVAFLGFQPGFPYLRGLPNAMHAPRRASPRIWVAAGSVAVGGAYTGIYPADGPGGWQIIGRTTATLFDPQRSAPALMMPGDRVHFVPHD
jgi:KipI family sensor histidine kinase inhibitor